MRKNVFATNDNTRGKKAALALIVFGVLILIFMLSFIVAYNMIPGKANVAGSDMDLVSENRELKTQINDLKYEVDSLRAQLERYKAIAGMDSDSGSKPTAKPSPSATPKASASPSATSTPKPVASATPKPSATATPKPTPTATPKETQTPIDFPISTLPPN